MRSALDITLEVGPGEEIDIDKVRAGLALIAEAIGRPNSAVEVRKYAYPSGETHYRFTAG